MGLSPTARTVAARLGNGGRPPRTRSHAPAHRPSVLDSDVPLARCASSTASSSLRAPPFHASGGRNGSATGAPVHHAHQRYRRRFVRVTATTARKSAVTGTFYSKIARPGKGARPPSLRCRLEGCRTPRRGPPCPSTSSSVASAPTRSRISSLRATRPLRVPVARRSRPSACSPWSPWVDRRHPRRRSRSRSPAAAVAARAGTRGVPARAASTEGFASTECSRPRQRGWIARAPAPWSYTHPWFEGVSRHFMGTQTRGR